MTFDPDKLRNLLLGGGSGDDEPAPDIKPDRPSFGQSQEKAPGAEPIDEKSGKKPSGKEPDKDSRPRPVILSGRKPSEELDALEKVKAEYFAPSRFPLAGSDEGGEESVCEGESLVDNSCRPISAVTR